MNVSQTTIFRAIDRKALRASTTPGGHYRVLREDLEQFLKANNDPIDVLEPRVKRVLVVEDNPVELQMVKRVLSAEPMLEVRGTASGYEAGLLTKSIKPDLILLDIFLNDVDGRNVAKLIREDPELKGTQIVAMTGSRDQAVLDELVQAGFADLLTKPLDAPVLLERVRRLLR